MSKSLTKLSQHILGGTQVLQIWKTFKIFQKPLLAETNF